MRTRRSRGASLAGMSDEEEDAIINKSVEVTPPRVDADPEHEESEAPTSDEEEDTDSVVMSDVGSDSSGEDMKEAYTDDMCCTKCGATDREELMVLCDGEGCNTGWHTFCLTPMLSAIPDGNWLCPTCEWVSPEEVVGSKSESDDTIRVREEVREQDLHHQEYEKHKAAEDATRAGKVRGVRDNKDTVIISSNSPHQERALPQLVYV